MTTSDTPGTRAARDPFALAARSIPGLDGLRGLACLMIFNVHFFAQFADVSYFVPPENTLLKGLIHAIHSGSLGVDIFFVISGYLIYGSTTRSRPALGEFFLKRYTRLLPVVLVINIPALYWVNAGWQQAVDNLFFLDLFGSPLVTFVSWALVYEMYFYILCGVWLIVFGCGQKAPPWRSFAVLVGLYIANSLFFHFNHVLSDWRFVGFFMGIGLAMLKADPAGRRLFSLVRPGFWPVGLAAVCLGCWLWSQDVVGALSGQSPLLALGFFMGFDLLVALMVACVVNAAASGGSGGMFGWLPLRVLGAVSYSLFLLHTQWGLPLANKFFGRPGNLAELVLHYGLSLGLSFGLAVFLYMHLEKFYFAKT